MAREKEGMEGDFKGKSPIRKGLRFREMTPESWTLP